MKQLDVTTDHQPRRPRRGTPTASEHEVNGDFESLLVPQASRCLKTKRSSKKPKPRLSLSLSSKQPFKAMELIEAVLGLASLIHESDVRVEKQPQPKRLLGLAATHVAIAAYIAHYQKLISTPSTAS